MIPIFFILTTIQKMKYEFENKVVLEVSEKLIIVATDPLVYYLIANVSYAKPLHIIKLMFIDLKFEVLKEASYTYNGQAKPGREIKPS